MTENLRDNKGPEELAYFLGHYVPWRKARLTVLVDHYGREWFTGKRVLELGCGYGHMGISLAMLGADVTFSDGRRGHLDWIVKNWPLIPSDKLIKADLESEWPFEGHWDLILHQGLLYHLTNWSFGLRMAAQFCDRMTLETETLDTDVLLGHKKISEDPEKMQSALSGKSVRVPAVRIEAALDEVGLRHQMCLDTRLNSGRHKYVWPVENSGKSFAGTRRWWWCWRDGHGPS